MIETKLSRYQKREPSLFPIAGSRGRNGDFTATSFAVIGVPALEDGQAPEIHVEGYSRRSGESAPLNLALSAPDAIVLAQALLEAAEVISGTMPETPESSTPTAFVVWTEYNRGSDLEGGASIDGVYRTLADAEAAKAAVAEDLIANGNVVHDVNDDDGDTEWTADVHVDAEVLQ